MSGKGKRVKTDDDNPEWTKEDFAQALAPGDALPAEVLAAFPRPRGRPRLAAPKVQVTLRLDRDVLERFKSGGPGWQGRMNEALKRG